MKVKILKGRYAGPLVSGRPGDIVYWPYPEEARRMIAAGLLEEVKPAARRSASKKKGGANDDS